MQQVLCVNSLPFFIKIFIQNDNLIDLSSQPDDKPGDDHELCEHLPQAVAEQEGKHHH